MTLHMQDLTERMRTLAVDADTKQARVSQLEAQLLEALSKGSDNEQQATVEVQWIALVKSRLRTISSSCAAAALLAQLRRTAPWPMSEEDAAAQYMAGGQGLLMLPVGRRKGLQPPRRQKRCEPRHSSSCRWRKRPGKQLRPQRRRRLKGKQLLKGPSQRLSVVL
jgi:hypothetical protein